MNYFLVAAQLPKSVSSSLVRLGHGSFHSLDLPEKNLSQDNFLLKVAREQGQNIITQDLEFLESQMVRDEPEKLILIKTGNIKKSTALSSL